MATQSQQSQGDQTPLLVASVHDVRYFASLLRSLSFSNRVTFTVTEGGLTACVEDSRTLLATAYIHSNIFDEYVYRPSSVASSQPTEDGEEEEEDDEVTTNFEIPLNILIDCLNIFGTAGPLTASSAPKHKRWKRASDDSDNAPDGTNDGEQNRNRGGLDQFLLKSDKGTGMRMTYFGPGYPLTLIIAEDSHGPTTTCDITTFDPEPSLELPFDDAQTIIRIILKSTWLRDALSELDPSYEKVTFIVNPSPQTGRSRRDQSLKPLLKIQAIGAYGSTEIDYPDDREVLETFVCEEATKFSYRMALISKTLRVLQSSTKTSLRIDGEGLLSLQFLMPSSRPRSDTTSDGYIEFRCLPLDEDV